MSLAGTTTTTTNRPALAGAERENESGPWLLLEDWSLGNGGYPRPRAPQIRPQYSCTQGAGVAPRVGQSPPSDFARASLPRRWWRFPQCSARILLPAQKSALRKHDAPDAVREGAR